MIFYDFGKPLKLKFGDGRVVGRYLMMDSDRRSVIPAQFIFAAKTIIRKKTNEDTYHWLVGGRAKRGEMTQLTKEEVDDLFLQMLQSEVLEAG